MAHPVYNRSKAYFSLEPSGITKVTKVNRCCVVYVNVAQTTPCCRRHARGRTRCETGVSVAPTEIAGNGRIRNTAARRKWRTDLLPGDLEFPLRREGAVVVREDHALRGENNA